MANPGYVRSTDGNNLDDGSTWALANASMTGAAADDAAGDTIYFSQAHSENLAASTNVTFGTNASPQKLICANDAAEPPTAVATGATIATNGGYGITLSGSFYAYGLAFKPGAGAAVNVSINLVNGYGDIQRYESCVFDVNGSGGSASILVGQGANQQMPECYWKSCDVKFLNSANDGIAVCGTFVWSGGSALSGTATPSDGLIRLTSLGEGAFVHVSGVNLSNFASTLNLVQTGTVQSGRVVFRNCKLPASWAGSLYVGAAIGLRAEMWNCSATDTNYALWVEDYAGSIRHETTLVKTGGASDGTTPISWKMATSANAEYPTIVLRSPEIAKWNETTGSAVTVTVDFLRDSATNLQDDEIWLEVEYLGTSGFPLSLFADDAAADVLATPADQATSAATWTTTGMSNPNEQKLSVTFTPQEKGLIIARVCIGLASTTIYVDPELQIS